MARMKAGWHLGKKRKKVQIIEVRIAVRVYVRLAINNSSSSDNRWTASIATVLTTATTVKKIGKYSTVHLYKKKQKHSRDQKKCVVSAITIDRGGGL